MFLKDYIHTNKDTVDKTATLQDVIDKMTTNKLHHIIIIEENKPIGIITERDFVKYFTKNINFSSLAIAHAMTDIITLHHTRLVEYALSMMIHNNIRKIVVIDNNEEYVGCIEQEDLLFTLEKNIQEKDIKLYQLTHSGNIAVLIDEKSTLKHALDIMTTKQLTSLLVTSNDEAIGTISESDIIKLAQSNVDQNKIVEEFMHSPIIKIDENKTTDDMMIMMQKNTIRRVVIFNKQDQQNYILTSKDLASTIKGNYTSFIESKFFDSRDTFNALSEYVVELIDINNEQVIFWANNITKENFDIHLDDTVTKLIAKDIWEPLLLKLSQHNVVYETIEIKNRFYQLKGHYGTIIDDNVIKLFLNDVTEVVRLTQELKKENEIKNRLLYEQSKMAAMGEMIGNIAHQWRQPLSIISTGATGMQVQKKFSSLSDEEFDKTCSLIDENAQYLSKTIDDFKNFIKGERKFVKFNLKKQIDSFINLISPSLKKYNLELVLDINDSINLEGYPNELTQCLMNIFNNAKDALVSNVIENRSIFISTFIENDIVFIKIKDNAGGISSEILPRIFELYFTTKKESQGTGLGLHMTYNLIVDGMNGSITVNNVDYEYKNKRYLGAEFTISLPCI